MQCNTQDLSANTYIEKDILHDSVYGAVIIAMKCPHSLWAFHILFLWTLPHRGTVSADFCPN